MRTFLYCCHLCVLQPHVQPDFYSFHTQRARQQNRKFAVFDFTLNISEKNSFSHWSTQQWSSFTSSPCGFYEVLTFKIIRDHATRPLLSCSFMRQFIDSLALIMNELLQYCIFFLLFPLCNFPPELFNAPLVTWAWIFCFSLFKRVGFGK